MLQNININPHAAVKDLAKARKFYEDTLGLKVAREDEGGIAYKCGGSELYVYESEFAGTNQATLAGWAVDDVEKTVQQLKDKGVAFEHYDAPGGKREGDIHRWGDFKAAWFKDPDGNIFLLSNEG